ncbi:MAG: RNA polymerase sigma factor [Beutenbergiaceae bacterium]
MRNTTAEADERAEHVLTSNADDLLAYPIRRMDSQDAPDTLSEVFATAWRRRDRIPADERQARMWLFVIARNVASNTRRANVRAQIVTDRPRSTLMMARGAFPGDEDDARAREVREAVADLPARQRELVRLVHWDGFSLSKAAQIAGMRASTARTHYGRARARLAAELAG